MDKNKPVTRREFLKVLGTHIAASLMPAWDSSVGRINLKNQLELEVKRLPFQIQDILEKIDKVEISEDGLGAVYERVTNRKKRLPLFQTQWNVERSNSFERLFQDASWGIVIHWFGITFEGDGSISGYLRGFDGLRKVGDYQTRTSAHFLVGGASVLGEFKNRGDGISIVQTQKPDRDGTPFVASHLFGLDYAAHRDRQQYFVRAWDLLRYNYPGIHPILTDFYNGPLTDPNYRTIAVELTGTNFDDIDHGPPAQQIANTVSLVCALMKRYKINIVNVLGHNEIELRKPDPGKIFINIIRYLVGIFALTSGDDELKHLVFDPFIGDRSSSINAIIAYFTFLRDYMILVAFPDQIYDWERKTNYWDFMPFLHEKSGVEQVQKSFSQLIYPVKEKIEIKKSNFLEPEYHSGVDLYLNENGSPFDGSKTAKTYLVAEGECIYTGRGYTCSSGYIAIFRHFQPDGASIISVYSNLSSLKPLTIGKIYPQGYQIGEFPIGSPYGEGFLHFAIAYGATWETVLRNSPTLSGNFSSEWIRRRFINPIEYIQSWEKPPFTT